MTDEAIAELREAYVDLQHISEGTLRISCVDELSPVLRRWRVLEGGQEPDLDAIQAALQAKGLWIDPTNRWAVRHIVSGGHQMQRRRR